MKVKCFRFCIDGVCGIFFRGGHIFIVGVTYTSRLPSSSESLAKPTRFSQFMDPTLDFLVII